MWNPRSFLFEVAICVMCYFSITILELLPVVTERSPLAALGRPSIAEWALSLGIIAAAMLVFFFVVENFAVFDERYVAYRRYRRRFHPILDRLTGVWQTTLSNRFQRVTFIAVITVPVAFGLFYPPYSSAMGVAPEPVLPPRARDAARNVLEIDGNRDKEYTVFDHADHQKRLGGKTSCKNCHHLAMPKDKGLGGMVPQNQSCATCHAEGEPKSSDNEPRGPAGSERAHCHVMLAGFRLTTR